MSVFIGNGNWRKNAMDGGGPYSVWKAPKASWWCVCDCKGLNILTNGTGQVFVGSEQEATQLAERWNA